jgi:hypothetical protein
MGNAISFVEFLGDPACREYCKTLFGGADTSAGVMLHEFRKAKNYHYYGIRPAKLTASKATSKKLLKKFARLAYRGDPDRRGVAYWERVAWLLSQTYDDLMALRGRAEKIKQQEIARIGGLVKKRAKRAAYMRRYRATSRANSARHANDETKGRSRQRSRLADPARRSNRRSRKSRASSRSSKSSPLPPFR